MPQPSAPAVTCFDVFDTVLTRAVGEPKALFLLLGYEAASLGLIEVSADVLAYVREQGELSARKASATGETTLSQIYDDVRLRLGITPHAVAAIRDLELDLERRMIRRVPAAKSLVQSSRDKGSAIAFVSDMYLPSAFIAERLLALGIAEANDRVFVSCEWGHGKRDGKLFQSVQRSFGVSSRNMTHHGDSVDADIRGAAVSGIRAHLRTECTTTKYESILNAHGSGTQGISALLSGTSRLTRMQLASDNDYEPAFDDVVCGVAAPFLISYVAWTLTQAKQRQIKSLYFVSRDGQIMLAVAQKLAGLLGVDCELRYLYGSRQAWHLPGLTSLTPADFSWIFEAHESITAATVLRRLQTDTPEARAALLSAGLPPQEFSQPLSTGGQRLMETLLTGDSQLRSLVLDNAAEQRRLFGRYLTSEQIGTNERWGMVDIGWRGRLQRSLERCLRALAIAPPQGFYVGLLRDDARTDGEAMQAYLFDHGAAEKQGFSPNGCAFVTELICQATHGMVTGYSCDNDSVRPVLNEIPTEKRIRWGVGRLHGIVDKYVDNLPHEAIQRLASADLRPAICSLIEQFWLRPEPAEALRWGGFPFETEQAGSSDAILQRPYSLAEAAELLVHGRYLGRYNSWHAASWLRTPTSMRAIHAAARRTRSIAKRLARRQSNIP